MLERRISAKSAKSVFYEDYNDIDIFIEDTAIGYKKIFKEILIRAFGHTLSIDQVFPLGNREQVINECKKHQVSSRRKQLYIIDGDLHLLYGSNPTHLKGLFVLPRYCVENYFLDEEAIIDVVDEEEPNLDKSSIKAELDFSNWLMNNEELLLKLFIYYSICLKHLPHIKTISHKVSQLCSSNKGIVDEGKIINRIDEIKSLLSAKESIEFVEVKYNEIYNKIKKDKNKLIKYVSAKDYLMPLIDSRIRSFAKFPPNDLSVKIRLAKKIDISEITCIKDYILS